MKLIEQYSDYSMSSDNNVDDKKSYLRYRVGRLKHGFWLKSRKSATTVYVEVQDIMLKTLYQI